MRWIDRDSTDKLREGEGRASRREGQKMKSLTKMKREGMNKNGEMEIRNKMDEKEWTEVKK